MSTQPTDGYLVARVREGDLEALGRLYDKYKMLVYRTALAITHDEMTAEDILQEAFLRVYRYADRIDENVPLGPWLYRVTVNLAYSWANRIKRWFHSLQDRLDLLNSSTQRYPEAVTEEREWQQILRQAIEALPAKHRAVVILFYLEGLSLEEIAYAMDIPEGTVKSRLYYARKKLKETLLEREPKLATEVAYDFT